MPGIEPTDLLFGRRQADLQEFDFTEPALSFSFGDAVMEVLSDLDQTRSLGRADDQDRAADARLSELPAAETWAGEANAGC
ncbi:hypothetical protein [Streptacidiphilus albus]|uniref:hypothetical protein n=1 Tax=Streptacidiphilus albus TaxID=105425 RepID=UPI000690C571|nr:hypothetical protein [Streptacidiphilus albus]